MLDPDESAGSARWTSDHGRTSLTGRERSGSGLGGNGALTIRGGFRILSEGFLPKLDRIVIHMSTVCLRGLWISGRISVGTGRKYFSKGVCHEVCIHRIHRVIHTDPSDSGPTRGPNLVAVIRFSTGVPLARAGTDRSDRLSRAAGLSGRTGRLGQSVGSGAASVEASDAKRAYLRAPQAVATPGGR